MSIGEKDRRNSHCISGWSLISRSAEATRAVAAGVVDIVESELAVGDIIFTLRKVVGGLINDPRQYRSNAVHIIAKAYRSANLAWVSWNIRSDRLDPLTVGSMGVLQESADLSARASYNRKINQTNLKHQRHCATTTAPICCLSLYQASSGKCSPQGPNFCQRSTLCEQMLLP